MPSEISGSTTGDGCEWREASIESKESTSRVSCSSVVVPIIWESKLEASCVWAKGKDEVGDPGARGMSSDWGCGDSKLRGRVTGLVQLAADIGIGGEAESDTTADETMVNPALLGDVEPL